MIKRIRQFFRAVAAKITEADRVYVTEHLEDAPQELFFAMDTIDQRHALNVAHTAEKLAATFAAVDRRLLIRAALLHDVGRRKGDMGLFGKTFAVLADKFFPNENDGKNFFPLPKKLKHIMYVYRRHAIIGAESLAKIGLVREADLIRRHHDAEKISDSDELKILRRADEMN